MADNKFNAMAPAQFNHEMFGTVRVLKGEGGEVWFVAKDVCDALTIDTSNLSKLLDDDERSTCPVQYTDQVRAVSIINESGLYSLILRSRKPEAKRFKKWVTSEVLPAVREHGVYMTPEFIEEVVENPDTIIAMANKLKKERLKRARFEAAVRPSIAFHERCTHKKTLWTISMAAKELGVTLSHLQVVLLRNGVLQQRGKRYWPREGYIHKGYFEVIPECNYGFTPGGLELARDLIKGNHHNHTAAA
jgi:prophage antirepressor-like protein